MVDGLACLIAIQHPLHQESQSSLHSRSSFMWFPQGWHAPQDGTLIPKIMTHENIDELATGLSKTFLLEDRQYV